MDNVKKILRVSSIINFILGISFLDITVYSAFLFALGFLFLIFSNNTDEQLSRNKNKILILSIFSIFVDFITFVLGLIAHVKINSYEKKVNGVNAPPVKYKSSVDRETKKIDILLKLGVGMVFISGILFSTTSWNFISDPVKVIFLIFFGFLFIALSLFTERKLKLYKSSYSYWILGVSFLLFSIIALLYFKIFGIAYYNEGRFLSFIITYFTVLGLSYATYLKFPKKYLLYVVYMSITLIITNIFKYFGIDDVITIILIALVLIVINILSREETVLSNYSKIISYLLFIFIFRNIYGSNQLLILIASITIIVNFYFLVDENDNVESIFSLIITYVLLFASIYNVQILGDYANILLFMVITFHTLLIKFNLFKVSKIYSYCNYVFYCFAFLFIYTITMIIDNRIMALIISSVFLVMNLVLTINIKGTKENIVSKYITPISIFLIILSVFNFLNIDMVMLCVTTSIVYALLYVVLKEDKVYLIYAIIGLFISLVDNFYDKSVITSLIILIPAVYLFVEALLKSDKVVLIFTYLALLTSIYNVISINNVLSLNSFISSIMFIWILIIFIILMHNDTVKKISYFAMIVPIYNIIEYFNYDYKIISISILVLYITFLIVKFFCKDDTSKNIVGVIGIIISVVELLYSTSYIVGIYVGIVGLGSLLLGYFYKERKPFFITGLVIVIVNIIVQLKNLWGMIPFWLYLLIGGLLLIGIVTYKEINKGKK